MGKSKETLSLFWGAETKTKKGRDPLGLQNSSVVIYSDMITGISNATSRVRYNGFFCWLLELIASHHDDADSQTEQGTLIRRGELLLAFMMVCVYPKVTGVSGSDFVRMTITGDKGNDIIDLASGADYEKNSKRATYLKNSHGIFGQHYVGPMTQLQLIIEVSDCEKESYKVTCKGSKLAGAYRKSFSENTEDLFWKSIYNGKVARGELASLKEMALHLINTEEELNEYQKIFCNEKDNRHRINSIKLILEYIKLNNKLVSETLVGSFLKSNLEDVFTDWDKASDEMRSWFLYELNELAHAAYEASHFAILHSITEDPQPLDTILDKLRDECSEYVGKVKDENDIYELYDNMQQDYEKKNFGKMLCEAAQMLIELHSRIKQKMCYFARENGYDVEHQGFAPTMLDRLVSDTKIVSWDFIKRCINSSVNDHLRSSYSKSITGQGLVHNYIVEDKLIWKLRETKPVRTSPRLQNVLQYIEDMKWIELKENHYNITERGLKILNNV